MSKLILSIVALSFISAFVNGYGSGAGGGGGAGSSAHASASSSASASASSFAGAGSFPYQSEFQNTKGGSNDHAGHAEPSSFGGGFGSSSGIAGGYGHQGSVDLNIGGFLSGLSNGFGLVIGGDNRKTPSAGCAGSNGCGNKPSGHFVPNKDVPEGSACGNNPGSQGCNLGGNERKPFRGGGGGGGGVGGIQINKQFSFGLTNGNGGQSQGNGIVNAYTKPGNTPDGGLRGHAPNENRPEEGYGNGNGKPNGHDILSGTFSGSVAGSKAHSGSFSGASKNLPSRCDGGSGNCGGGSGSLGVGHGFNGNSQGRVPNGNRPEGDFSGSGAPNFGNVEHSPVSKTPYNGCGDGSGNCGVGNGFKGNTPVIGFGGEAAGSLNTPHSGFTPQRNGPKEYGPETGIYGTISGQFGKLNGGGSKSGLNGNNNNDDCRGGGPGCGGNSGSIGGFLSLLGGSAHEKGGINDGRDNATPHSGGTPGNYGFKESVHTSNAFSGSLSGASSSSFSNTGSGLGALGALNKGNGPSSGCNSDGCNSDNQQGHQASDPPSNGCKGSCSGLSQHDGSLTGSSSGSYSSSYSSSFAASSASSKSGSYVKHF